MNGGEAAMRKIFLAIIVALAAPVPALADGLPEFLSGGQVWATDPAGCAAGEGGEEVYFTLRADGVYGYEFGCTFAQFLPARTSEGETVGWIAIASCGDDSGISRPDLFNLSAYDSTLTVTAQNEWNSTNDGAEQSEEELRWSLVHRDFALCEAAQ